MAIAAGPEAFADGVLTVDLRAVMRPLAHRLLWVSLMLEASAD